VYLQYVRVHLDQGASDIHRPAHHSAARTYPRLHGAPRAARTSPPPPAVPRSPRPGPHANRAPTVHRARPLADPRELTMAPPSPITGRVGAQRGPTISRRRHRERSGIFTIARRAGELRRRHPSARTHLVQRRTYDPSGADPPGPPRPCS